MGGNQPKKVINIPSRYGAVAYDSSKIIVGATDNNLKSLRAAKKEAVQRCIGYGGSKSSCKVVAATRNGCNALALGGAKLEVGYMSARLVCFSKKPRTWLCRDVEKWVGRNALSPIPNAPAIRAIK
ncbi:hypothetical protein BWD09_10310 [Neisseria dentiae]|uniref:DUF4189 domain-containing protein n=1 Tax=Neisseria dentiae TaxID=194197 RepID=A0A1X3D3L6_9NEIS|nr:hypothetical protein BWD09_10310 [Neisseria dentiae]QMT44351.1 DUF4189 domain-containing protein [Neisseria dentiae]